MSALAGWSLGKIFTPPPATTAQSVVNTFTVRQGSLGKAITLNAAAAWGSEASGINRAAGVVTSMEPVADPKVSGDPIYAADLAPVALVAGSTPAFREITTGTEGPDVVQLAAMLAERGYGVDPETSKVDWVFAQAIKAWQRDIGAKDTGTVANGAVIFAPGLPARIQFDPDIISVGATLAGGEKVLTVASAVPEFTIEVPNEQAQTIPVGTPVSIKNGEARWPGQVSGIRELANGSNKLLVLGSATDTPICGADCGALTAVKDALFPTEITLVPHQEGLVVPSSAIRTNASGGTSVMLASGTDQPVEVVGTSSGMSIVTGVDAGTVIQLWAPAAPKP
ncbi:peptidoglycan-binding protein [Arthrobacter sp. PAMC 25486]|uniref:peptidoglycan-binding domain-containing protein n=1 Tax=Arthrobacter sp. PAMC 25486 TaxID=1494608 RepID=UPI0012FEDB63|nr:peptidoglycan-binding domain-containing protein [Arthrobacter sp. PAMC 25486]